MKIRIQMPRNASIFKMPQCATRSALDKNLNAKASSRNPKITLVVLSHPPDFGNAPNMLGNKAKIAKGSPKARPKPVIPAVSCQAPPSTDKDPASKDPRIGPVQEKETMARVRAIKKIPINPFEFSPFAVELVQLAGRVSS